MMDLSLLPIIFALVATGIIAGILAGFADFLGIDIPYLLFFKY